MERCRSGRRTALRDGPDVWEVAVVAREYIGDLEGPAAHVGGGVLHAPPIPTTVRPDA